jgi:hypothetical protein
VGATNEFVYLERMVIELVTSWMQSAFTFPQGTYILVYGMDIKEFLIILKIREVV